MYSTLAGFVESGESLEEAVHREVKEEVGIKIKNLRYFDSQAWPFPHSIMMGYIAEHASGEINIDDDEICDANWYENRSVAQHSPASIYCRSTDTSHKTNHFGKKIKKPEQKSEPKK